MTINDRVRKIRADEGFTLRQFAERIGISDSAVSQIEKGKSGVSDQTIRSICREFGVNETWLRTGFGEPRVSQYREQEMAALFKDLMADRPESFRRALVSALLRFDPNGDEWEILEKIYDSVAKELSPPEDPEK